MDKEGEVRPKAVLERENEVGISVARSKMQEGDTLIRVKISVVEEVK